MDRVDVDAAWRLLRTVRPGEGPAVFRSAGVDGPAGETPHHREATSRSDLGGPSEGGGDLGSVAPVALVVEADGSWSTTPPADEAARDLLDLFLPFRRAPKAVIGQLGQSVDGRIATASGHSHYINGPEDIRRLHRLRALADVVIVGAGTVEADDPRLTVREAEGPNPVRVVLDPRGRLPQERNVFQDGAAPTVWLLGPDTPDGADAPGSPAQVEVLRLPLRDDGTFAPWAVLEALRDRGHTHVLVEGGGHTVSGFLAAGALDRLHLSVAPLLLGSGRPGISLPEIGTLDEALRPAVRHFRLGRDLLFDLDLRAPGPDAGG